MDATIAASARALAAGDALAALKQVALRDDPPALALRGIALAQLGEHARARELLKQATRAFGSRELLARARCVLAEAEVGLAMRDLQGSSKPLVEAAAALHKHGDAANALHARLLAARRFLLLGKLADASAMLEGGAAPGMPPMLTAVAALARAELALRSLRPAAARESLALAHQAAYRTGIPALIAEVSDARAALDRPAARRVVDDQSQALTLDEVQGLLEGGALVVDACRRGLAHRGRWLPLARRPILFSLARTLAQAWPGDVERDELIATAFRTRRPDETHRARLRVEIGRLRALAKDLAGIEATPRGFALRPAGAGEVAVIEPPIEGEQASIVALLADGAAWSTSALALATGVSQRTVQRALTDLEAAGQVRAIGLARARRWVAPPLAGFTTILLLPASLPGA